MSWTYSGDPSTSSLDSLRFMLGDTDSANPILQDEEINWVISQNTSIDDAAYSVCMGIIAKYSRLADKSVGKVSIKYSQIVKQYQQLANKLWLNAGIVVTPYAGGIDVADNQAKAADNSIEQPSFRRGVFDNKRYF